MKNLLRPLAFLLGLPFLVQLVYSEDINAFKPRFSLKLAAGLISAGSLGDVNDGLESFNSNEVFESLRKSYRLIGQIQTLDNQAFDWEAEIRFNLTARIGFGIAVAAPFHTHNKSSVTYTYGDRNTSTWTFKPEVRVFFPIRMSAYYTLSFIPRLSISIGGGVGVYPSKIAQFIRWDETYQDEKYWATWDQEAKRDFALGYHGTAALEYILNHRFAVIAEFQARYVKIGNFKGKEAGPDVWGGEYDVNGTLYFYSGRNTIIGTSYARLRIFEEPVPDDPSLVGLREAVLDLSGFSLRIGLRMKLF